MGCLSVTLCVKANFYFFFNDFWYCAHSCYSEWWYSEIRIAVNIEWSQWNLFKLKVMFLCKHGFWFWVVFLHIGTRFFLKSFFWSLLTAGVKYFPFLPQENREYHKRSLVFLLFPGKDVWLVHIPFKPVLNIFISGQPLCQVFDWIHNSLTQSPFYTLRL